MPDPRTTQHPATLPKVVTEDWDGHLWRLAATTDRHARSRPCAHPDCLWLVTIHHDHDTGTWTLCRCRFQISVDEEKSMAAFHRYDCWRELHRRCGS